MANQKQKQGDSGKQGFASMDKDKQRDVASKGGQASGGGKDPQRSSEDGRDGGKQGGGNFANDPERASEAGRKGGESSRGGKGGSGGDSR